MAFSSACRHEHSVETAKSTAPNVFQNQLGPGSLEGFNLLFITLDTVRRDHLGCYGKEEAHTPNIDVLANQSVLFEHAMTASPSTLPSHCSMFTGLELPSHGVRTNGRFNLAEEKVTLAEMLAQQGYNTGAIVSTYVIDSKFGMSQGFEHYEDMFDETAPKGQQRRSVRTAQHVSDGGIDLLQRFSSAEGQGSRKPFFLWLHYFDAHLPYNPPERFAKLFPGSEYDAEIAFVDEQVGRILREIENLGLRDRTLIVLTSDHGEGLGEHGEPTHSRLIYDTTMRIPLMLSCPTFFVAPLRVADVTVGTIDLMPTILTLLGIETDSDFDGLDLATSLVPRDRGIYLETVTPFVFHRWACLYGWRSIDAKYIDAPHPEFYRLDIDPGELENLLQSGQALTSDFPEKLRRYRDRWEDFTGLESTSKPVESQSLQRLAALGYVETNAAAEGAGSDLLDPKDVVPILSFLNKETPAQLGRRSFAKALGANASSSHYRQALIMAQVATRAEPKDVALQLAEGISLYRVGRFAEAAELLRAIPDSDNEGQKVSQIGPVRSLFLAMSLKKIKRNEKAATIFDGVPVHVDPHFAPLYKEAEQLIRDD